MNAPPRQDKFRTYRDRKKAAGLREVRMWVPDVRSHELQQTLARQIEAINNSPSEAEACDWADRNAAEIWRDLA